MLTSAQALRRVVAVSGVFLLAAASAGLARSADEDVIDKMSVATVERLMKSLDLEFEEVDNNAYSFQTQGLKVILFNKEETLQLYAGFTGRKITLSRINEWNKTKRFSRAYLDKDNDPVIEADIELTGGVTEANFKEWMKTYFISVKAFQEHIDQ